MSDIDEYLDGPARTGPLGQIGDGTDVEDWALEADEEDYRERLADGRLAGQVTMEMGYQPDGPVEDTDLN